MYIKHESENFKGKGKEDIGIDGKIILKLVLKEQDVKVWNIFI
jgi:hypothetical protein